MQVTKNQVSEETQKKIEEMVKNPSILKEASEGTPFFDTYKGWSRDERWYFQNAFFKRYFWSTNTIIPLWNANEYKDFARLDEPLEGESGLNPVQESILRESTDTLIELIPIDLDVDIELRWARLLMLRKETRVENAQKLLREPFLDNIFINRLATDIVNQAKKKKEQPWWKQLFG